MNTLPTQWETMSHAEQALWLARYWLNYIADGEVKGLREDAPEEVRKAYEAWLKAS